jgi:hypothetical protein
MRPNTLSSSALRGTGKSTAIREMLSAALARGDRAVIADPDGGYLSHPMADFTVFNIWAMDGALAKLMQRWHHYRIWGVRGGELPFCCWAKVQWRRRPAA